MEEKQQVSTEKTSGGETVTAKTTTSPVSSENKSIFQAYYLVYFLLGVIEVFLAARLIFKLLGAGSTGVFVSFIYSVTDVIAAPFLGIFHTTTAAGVETTSVLEPATIIAMVVYAIAGWGLAKLVAIMLAGKE
jgi:hypothetical protein